MHRIRSNGNSTISMFSSSNVERGNSGLFLFQSSLFLSHSVLTAFFVATYICATLITLDHG